MPSNDLSVDRLWVIVDSHNRIVHQTHDESNLEFMEAYVQKALAAGDAWRILYYELIVAPKAT